jgi:hypothetical protein
MILASQEYDRREQQMKRQPVTDQQQDWQFQRQQTDLQRKELAAAAPGQIQHEALNWPVLSPAPLEPAPAKLPEAQPNVSAAMPGSGVLMVQSPPPLPPAPSAPQRTRWRDLPDYERNNFYQRYGATQGLTPAQIGEQWDAGVASAQGRAAGPVVLPVTLPGRDGPLGFTVDGKFQPMPKENTPPAVFPVTDPLTGERLGTQVGGSFVKPGAEDKPPKIKVSERGADGRTITREVSQQEFDDIEAGKADEQWFSEVMLDPDYQAYKKVYADAVKAPDAAPGLFNFTRTNKEILADARAALREKFGNDAEYLIQRTERGARPGNAVQPAAITQPGLMSPPIQPVPGYAPPAGAAVPTPKQPLQSGAVQIGAPPGRADGGGVPTVTTVEEYNALPGGAVYLEDGTLYRKP